MMLIEKACCSIHTPHFGIAVCVIVEKRWGQQRLLYRCHHVQDKWHFDIWYGDQVGSGAGNSICYVTMVTFIRPRGHSIFWWVCAARVFKSRVYRTDFFFKKLGSWEQIFTKISVFGAEILPKLKRNGPKKAEFFRKQRAEELILHM